MVVMFLYLAVILFSMFPWTTKIIKRRSLIAHSLMTFTVFTITCYLLFSLDKTLLAIYVAVIFLIWLVCPLWLFYMQRYKLALRGPWDIASLPENKKDVY